ncbi:MAG: hypothetical protein P1V81_13020 [Planctomycetota bacterium]|nr:hypothetical protein [Planctomycetota bacterium]
MTRPGWLGPGEVVEVTFDPKVVSYASLLAHAKSKGCTDMVYTRTDEQQAHAAKVVGAKAKRSDAAIRIEGNKYYLSTGPVGAVPMTEAQASRLHANLEPEALERWLSPRQRELLARTIAAQRADPEWRPPSAIGVPLTEAWAKLEASLAEAEATQR